MSSRQTITTPRNGVDVAKLFETIEAVKETPGLAEFEFRADNEWIDGGYNRSKIGAYYGAGQEHTTRTEPFDLPADEPPVLLGEDRGPNPVEFVLHALAACLTTSLVYHAAARGIQIEAVSTRLEGDLDLHGFLGLSPDVRKGYQKVRVKMSVKSDAPPETLRELCQFSPVFDTISNPVPVTIDLDTT